MLSRAMHALTNAANQPKLPSIVSGGLGVAVVGIIEISIIRPSVEGVLG